MDNVYKYTQEGRHRQMLSCANLACDFFWAVEREFMVHLFGQARLHHKCNENPMIGFDKDLRRGGCCSFSESLLSYAKNYSTSPDKPPLSLFWPKLGMYMKVCERRRRL